MLLAALLPCAARGLPVEWDSLVRLTGDGANQLLGQGHQRSIAVDLQRNVHVAWLDDRVPLAQVWHRRFDAAAGRWLPETALTARPANCARPSVACDAAGNVHLAWHSAAHPDYGIWYKRFDAAAGRWQPETLLVTGSLERTRLFPAVACRPGGREVHIVWYGTPDTGIGQAVFHIEHRPDSGWGRLTQLTQSRASREMAAIAVAGDNTVSVVWSGTDFATERSQIACIRRVSGVWGAVERVSNLGYDLTQSEPALAVEPGTGVLHAVWKGVVQGSAWLRVFYCRRAPGGWGIVTTVQPRGEYSQARPTVAWRATGQVSVAWCAADDASPSASQVQFSERDTAGLWSPAERLTAFASGTVDHPSIAADRWGRLHVAFQGAPGGQHDVYYRLGVPAGAGLGAEPVRGQPVLVACPSPARDWVRIECAGPVTVRDAAGRVVACPQSADGRVVRLDVRGLLPGVYFADAARFVRR